MRSGSHAFDEDKVLLLERGYQVVPILERPGFVRALVSGDSSTDTNFVGGSTKVEWVHDTAWRFMPVVESEVAGKLLHPVDLAINKLLALVGRDEPRDFLDTIFVHETVVPLGALVWATAGKDPGFSPGMLMDLLRRRGRIRAEDLARLRLNVSVELTELKQKWLLALEQADEFIVTRPSVELGCLYYSSAQKRFVQPSADDEVVPHFARPGGVLPLIRED